MVLRRRVSIDIGDVDAMHAAEQARHEPRDAVPGGIRGPRRFGTGGGRKAACTRPREASPQSTATSVGTGRPSSAGPSLISIASCAFVLFVTLRVLIPPERPKGVPFSAARGWGGRRADRGSGGGLGGVLGLGLFSPSTKTAERPAATRPGTFKVIILTMERLASLKRLVDSLSHPDCAYASYGMEVDLIFHVNRPKNGKDTAAWIETVRWTVDNVTWPHGSVSTLVANENMGLRQAWLEAWRPEGDDGRAIILEDDVTVSPLWYRWVNGAYDAYGHEDGRVAGYSLQRQDLVPLASKTSTSVPANDNVPFLYSLVGSIGFAPNARVWRDFLDWAECAIDNDVDVSVDGLVTSEWWNKLDKGGMWTQHFIYYMKRLGLGCLYHFPQDAGKALGVHWREKGEHYQRRGGASHGVVTDPGDISNLVFPRELNSYDFGAEPIKPRARPTTLVVAAAVGYSADVFDESRWHWLVNNPDSTRSRSVAGAVR